MVCVAPLSVARVRDCALDPRFGPRPETIDANGFIHLPLSFTFSGDSGGPACPDAPAPTCMVAAADTSAFSDRLIVCRVAAGAGRGAQVRLRNFLTPLNAGYAAPVVAVVVPQLLPTSGGNLTVHGANFGSSACAAPGAGSSVSLLMTADPVTPPAYLEPSSTFVVDSLQKTQMLCAVLLWTDTRVVCAAPAGLDAVVEVRVSVGGQSVAASNVLGIEAPRCVSIATLWGGLMDGGGWWATGRLPRSPLFPRQCFFVVLCLLCCFCGCCNILKRQRCLRSPWLHWDRGRRGCDHSGPRVPFTGLASCRHCRPQAVQRHGAAPKQHRHFLRHAPGRRISGGVGDHAPAEVSRCGRGVLRRPQRYCSVHRPRALSGRRLPGRAPRRGTPLLCSSIVPFLTGGLACPSPHNAACGFVWGGWTGIVTASPGP